MANSSLQYVTLDVFTNTRLQGNQLAIVELSPHNQLSESQKLEITREFNYSETVFLHPITENEPPRIQIFTLTGEMDFAGHPTIGAAHYLFHKLLSGSPIAAQGKSMNIITKAGPVAVTFDQAQNTMAADIPFDIHLHSNDATKDQILATQPKFSLEASEVSSLKDSYPVLSIVNGVTYALVDLTEAPGLMARVERGNSPAVNLDSAWTPSFIGTMYFRRISSDPVLSVEKLHVRMIAIGLEDPACGSGSCALAVYLALQKGGANRKFTYDIDQGAEIGRQSRIIVQVLLDADGTGVANVSLSGEAALVMQGTLGY